MAKKALKMDDAQFRALIERGSELIAVVQPDGTIGYASPAYQRVIDVAPEALLGRRAFDFVHPDDLPMVREHLARLQGRPGASVHFEFRYRYADGPWRVFDSISTNLLDDPSVAGTVVNSRDITTRKLRENTLQLLSTGMAHLRDAELFEEVARQMARIVGVEIGLVCKLVDQPSLRLRTLGLCIDGGSYHPSNMTRPAPPASA